MNCVAAELEALRSVPQYVGADFPNACRRLVRSLPGNSHCIDCGSPNPEWASVTYGCLLCISCCGRHRSYGVQTSVVRSINMDAWNHEQVLAMLEGGNDQLRGFFDRHEMGNSTPAAVKRYHTKAALFYKTNLTKHIKFVSEAGQYRGREANRRRHSVANKKPIQCAKEASRPTAFPVRVAVQ